MKRNILGYCVAIALVMVVLAPASYAGDSGCMFEVIPNALSLGDEGAAEITVNSSNPHCAFTATSDSSWVAVSPARTEGSTTVKVTASPSNELRVAKLHIAGHEVPVFQIPDAYRTNFGW